MHLSPTLIYLKREVVVVENNDRSCVNIFFKRRGSNISEKVRKNEARMAL